jgi:hypothetical protein
MQETECWKSSSSLLGWLINPRPWHNTSVTCIIKMASTYHIDYAEQMTRSKRHIRIVLMVFRLYIPVDKRINRAKTRTCIIEITIGHLDKPLPAQPPYSPTLDPCLV